jgi:hypothetical protein
MRRAALPIIVGILVLASIPLSARTTVVDVSTRTPWPQGCGVPGEQTKDAEAEPHIAVNPRNPKNIVVVYQQDRFAIDGGALSNVVVVTKDGGATWKRVLVPKLSRCTGGVDERASDPWLSFAGDGTLYLASLSFSEAPQNQVIAGAVEDLVQTSRDGGFTWSNPVYVQPFDETYNDRAAVTADPKRKGYAYHVFVKRYGALGESGFEQFSMTKDGGKTWTLPRPILLNPPLTVADPTFIEVLPDGSLLNIALLANLSPFLPEGVPRVPWLLVASRSSNLGTTWSLPVVIASMAPAAPVNPDNGEVVRSYNVISVDVARDGTAYVAWNEIASPTDSSIFVARSTDGGQTWSGPLRAAHVRSQAFLPALAVDGRGTLAVLYDDFRRDRHGDRALTSDVWLTRSYDHGRTWREVHVAGPFDILTASETDSAGVKGLFVGDYQGLAGLPSGFAAAFAVSKPLSKFGPSDVFFGRWDR